MSDAPVPVPPRIGISSCLLGEAVRWDGGHKRDSFLCEVLGPLVEWIPVCPEVEAGMGVPREAIRFEEDRGRVRLRGEGSGRDHTARMERFSRRRVEELDRPGLDGYVLKQGSPSCGVHDVKVHRPGHAPDPTGLGVFAAAAKRAWPNLPVEEEGRLEDPILREHFVERVFAWQRLRAALAPRFSRARLLTCHQAHGLQLMSHDEDGRRLLDDRVAQSTGRTLGTRYAHDFTAILARPATRAGRNRVLGHCARYLKPFLAEPDRDELHREISAHRRGHVPLLVPVTLIRHHARVHEVASLVGQTFLEPHPHEWMLRNHV